MGNNYITRDNVDYFFLGVVSEMLHCSPQHCCRFVSGLQWHANFCEHIGEIFIVDSPVVKSVLKQQKSKYYSTHGGEEEQN
eukprot:13580533-Ditylum_brightwellii.AAC.1